MEELRQKIESVLLQNDVEEMLAISRACKCDMVLNSSLIRSVEMCKILLAFGWPMVHDPFPFPCDIDFNIQRTLLLNGRQLGYKRNLREGFVEYRRCIIALLGLKSKRRIFQDLDRFVIREIAFSVWASRYEYVEPKEKIFQYVCIAFLLQIMLMSSEIAAAAIFFLIRAYTTKKINILGVLSVLSIGFIYFSVSKLLGRALAAGFAGLNCIHFLGTY